MSGGRRLTLDVVRGIAILLVLMFHFAPLHAGPVLGALAAPFARAGWVGVDLFFVLSGFLVGRMILVEAASPGGFDYARFLVRRAWRLWPALFLYLGVLWLAGGAEGWRAIWPVLLHVQNYADSAPSHLWSLAVEEHFYLGAALLLPLLARGNPTRVLAGLAAVASLSLLLRLGALASGAPLLALQWQTQFRLEGLALGVALAWCSIHRPHWLAAAGRLRPLLLALAATGFASLAIGDADAFRHGVGFTIAALAAAALLVAMLDAAIPPLLAAPARALAALGTIAYSLYIWHASLGRVGEALAVRAGIGHPAAVLALQLVLAIGVSWALYRLVERPALRLRDRRESGQLATVIAINSQVQRFP